jgi:hypothetical protein
MEITKEQFEAYNKAVEQQKIAVWATYAIAKLTGLSYEEVNEISKNYSTYNKKYGKQ